MSQQEIIDILVKMGKPLSRGEIAKLLNLDPIKISHTIQRLIEGHDILVKEIDRFEAMKDYHCQRRMRLYYIID